MNPAGFEPAASTFAESRSYSAELRVREIYGGRCGSRTHRSFEAPTIFKTAWRCPCPTFLSFGGSRGSRTHTGAFAPATLAGSCHTVRRDFLESGRGDTSRTCIVLWWTRVWSPLHCQLCYAPLLVHAAGLEPAVSHLVILIYSQVPSPLGPRMRNLL